MIKVTAMHALECLTFFEFEDPLFAHLLCEMTALIAGIKCRMLKVTRLQLRKHVTKKQTNKQTKQKHDLRGNMIYVVSHI